MVMDSPVAQSSPAAVLRWPMKLGVATHPAVNIRRISRIVVLENQAVRFICLPLHVMMHSDNYIFLGAARRCCVSAQGRDEGFAGGGGGRSGGGPGRGR